MEVEHAHRRQPAADTGAVYYMTGTLTAYTFSGGYYRVADQAGQSVRALGGTTSVNLTLSESTDFARWSHVRFVGSAMGRQVVATSPVYYVP